MKKTIKFIGAIAFVAMLSSSCQRDGLLKEMTNAQPENGINTFPTSPEEQSIPRVSNGYLVFADLKSFERTIGTLNKDGFSLEQWEKRFKGFESIRLLQQQSSENEVTISKNKWAFIELPDLAFRTVLSNQGRIQIADTLYQFEPGKEDGIAYAIPQASANLVVSGKLHPSMAKGVITHKTSISILPFPRWEDSPVRIEDPQSWNLCDFPNAFLFPWWGQKGGSVYHDDYGAELPRDNGRRIRVDYHRWRVGYVFYSSIGVRVKLWKDTRLGGWMSNIRMDKVSMEACTKGKIITPGLWPINFQESVSIAASNTNELEKTLKWSSAMLHTEVIPEHFNFHFKAYFRTKPVERFIRE